MLSQALADLVVVVHFAFIVFALCGALLTLAWRWVAWIHVPAMLWAAIVAFTGRICPLTPFENWLRQVRGGSGYRGGFIEHYLVPLVYPAGLTREIQVVLGAVLVAVNIGLYLFVWHRRIRAGQPHRASSRR